MPRGPSHLEGVSAALETLRGLTDTVQRNVGRRALKKTAQRLADIHKATLPVSDSPYDKTPGSLKGSPTVVSAKGGKGKPAVAMLIEDPAAAPGEFGTHKMRPHLKVRSTTDSRRGELAVILGEALKVEVDVAAKRAAKKG